MFSIALSIATGYGVYSVIRDNKSATPAPVEKRRAPAPPLAAPVVEPPAPAPVEEAPPVRAMSNAEARAVDPIVDEDGVTSPVMGIPGIDGAIERGSVDRRMRAKSLALQSCWERSEDPRVTVRMMMFVDENGRVTSAGVSPGLSPEAETCIVAVLRSISFSSPGRVSEIVQPIAFR